MAGNELLTTVLVQGLAAGIVAALLRTWDGAPFPAVVRTLWRDNKKRKPLGCPVCMGTWAALLVAGAAHIARVGPELHGTAYLMQILASAGVAAWLNGAVVPPALTGMLDDLDNSPKPPEA